VTSTAPRFADIKDELLKRLDSLVRELAPTGKKSGAYWLARDPTGARKDTRPSFWILLKGPARGAFKDEATQEHGDIIDAIRHCKNLVDRRATRTWALSWLGWGEGFDRKALERRRAQNQQRQEAEEREARETLARKRKGAKGWWLQAQPKIEGTVAEAYLASRGIDISRLASPPRALRFLPVAEHHDPDGVITEWPCMISAMCDATGAIVAVHRTFLAPDGSGKAPVSPTKMIWPHGYAGAVIRLSRGTGKLTPEDAARAQRSGPLIITEGIEDGLSIALACPDYRVWAAGTLGNMAHVPVDHPCVSKVIVFADNDAGAQARAAADKAVAALRLLRPVTVAHSFVGKDANDLLRGQS